MYMPKTLPYLFGEKLAAGALFKPPAEPQAMPPAPKPQPLAKPQAFPKAPAADPSADVTPVPPVYEHPSGAQQLGQAQFAAPVNTRTFFRQNLPRQEAVVPAVSPSPGRDRGADVLRISHHGGGDNTGYELSNPGVDAAGHLRTATSIPVGSRAAYLNPQAEQIKPPTRANFPDDDARYDQSRKWNVQTAEAQAALEKGPALPADTNPEAIISQACNNDPNGCTPATYARWLNAERGLHAGYAEQLAARPTVSVQPKAFSSRPSTLMDRARSFLGFNKPPAQKAPEPEITSPDVTPPALSPLRLNKVVMTPPGYVGVGRYNNFASKIMGDSGSFGSPYLTENTAPVIERRHGFRPSPAHEYRLAKGGDPTIDSDWTDTGIYTDARQSSVPFIGAKGEAMEFGRHLGLGKELGGGNALSYLDKIRDINANPDATYMQKVRSNWARPVGSALEFGRNISELTRPQTPVEGFSPIN